jgi:hypothetical protein
MYKPILVRAAFTHDRLDGTGEDERRVGGMREGWGREGGGMGGKRRGVGGREAYRGWGTDAMGVEDEG